MILILLIIWSSKLIKNQNIIVFKNESFKYVNCTVDCFFITFLIENQILPMLFVIYDAQEQIWKMMNDENNLKKL